MAEMDSQPAPDLSLQPAPVLLETVLKVERVVARLQNLRSTISGIHLSPGNPKQTRSSRASSSSPRALNCNDSPSGKENAARTRCQDENRRKSSVHYNADIKMQPEHPLKSEAQWKQWSSPANQVHNVMSEILMASQFAKQIAELVAEALQEKPQKSREPADQIQDPKKRVSKDVMRREGAPGWKEERFPTKAQVQKTMSAKAPLSKPGNKFKAAFPFDSTVKLVPAAKLSRPKDPPSRSKSGPASPPKRRISEGNWSNSLSPNSLFPRSPRLGVQSPVKLESHKLFSSPSGSFGDSDDADNELSGSRRHLIRLTESKVPAKAWKISPTKGVMFSNPVYLPSPPKSLAAWPSPEKIVPTTGRSRRSSWLTHQFPESPVVVRRESMKHRSSPPANPLSASFSKATFKREGATSRTSPKSDLATGLIKRVHKARKASMAPPSRYIEMVPLDGPPNSSIMAMLDVLGVRSPPRLPAVTPAMPDRTSRGLMLLNANKELLEVPAVTDRINELAEDLQCSASHSHTKSSPNIGNLANEHEKPSAQSKEADPSDSSDKENSPVPCTPAAVMFLRNMSSGHTLKRSLSRKNSGVSLLQRAKGWMSSQAVRQGRVHELERSTETSGFFPIKRQPSSVLKQALALCSTVSSYVQQACPIQHVCKDKTTDIIQPNNAHMQKTKRGQPLPPTIVYKFKVIYPNSHDLTAIIRPRKRVHVFKVHYPSEQRMAPKREGTMKPTSSIETMRGPRQWPKNPSTISIRHTGIPTWLRRATDWISSITRGSRVSRLNRKFPSVATEVLPVQLI